MAQPQDVSAPPSRVWLLSTPRSGSHLLTKIFSKLSKLSYSGYNFMEYIYQHHKLMDQNVTLYQLPTADRDELLRTAKDGLAQTKSIVDKLEAEGKMPFIKEHMLSIMDPFLTLQPTPGAQNHTPWKALLSGNALNPTILPDAYLSSFKSVLLIRHPALAYPSLYRATRAIMPHITIKSKGLWIEFSLTWMRMVYEWFEQAADTSGVCKPIVVDADDLILDREVVCKLATMIGGDPDELVFEWDAVTGKELEDVQPVARVYESTLLASRGIIRGKSSSGLSIEREAEGWAVEFGEEVAAGLRGYVEEAMGDYEYLKARRLR